MAKAKVKISPGVYADWLIDVDGWTRAKDGSATRMEEAGEVVARALPKELSNGKVRRGQAIGTTFHKP